MSEIIILSNDVVSNFHSFARGGGGGKIGSDDDQ